MEGRVWEHDNPDGPRCFKCDVTCKDAANLRNHVLSHFYKVFYDVLPKMKPLTCPEPGCDVPPARDRITLARHYAFCHRKIFEMTEVTPEQLQFTGGKGRGAGCKRKSKEEGGEKSATPKKVKTFSDSDRLSASPKKLVSKAFINSSDDDNDMEKGETKKDINRDAVKPENKIITFGKVVAEKEKLKKKHKKKEKERDKDRDREGKQNKDHKHKHKEKDREKSKKHKKAKDKENPLLRLIADLKGFDSSSNESKSLTVGPSWDASPEDAKKGRYLGVWEFAICIF